MLIDKRCRLLKRDRDVMWSKLLVFVVWNFFMCGYCILYNRFALLYTSDVLVKQKVINDVIVFEF